MSQVEECFGNCWYQATKDRRKGCLLYHPQLDRNNGRKSTRHFLRRSHVRTLHSQLDTNNLHLADLRHGRNFFGSGYSSLTCCSVAVARTGVG